MAMTPAERQRLYRQRRRQADVPTEQQSVRIQFYVSGQAKQALERLAARLELSQQDALDRLLLDGALQGDTDALARNAEQLDRIETLRRAQSIDAANLLALQAERDALTAELERLRRDNAVLSAFIADLPPEHRPVVEREPDPELEAEYAAYLATGELRPLGPPPAAPAPDPAPTTSASPTAPYPDDAKREAVAMRAAGASYAEIRARLLELTGRDPGLNLGRHLKKWASVTE